MDVWQSHDCAIAVKDNGRASMLYSNGSDIKSGQIAYASSLYTNGDDWHTRTIFEDVNVSGFGFAIMPNYFEWGVFRNDLGNYIASIIPAHFGRTRFVR